MRCSYSSRGLGDLRAPRNQAAPTRHYTSQTSAPTCSTPLAQKTYCCTVPLRKTVPGCHVVGHMIIAPRRASSGEVWQHDVTFGVNQSRSQLLEEFKVDKSGVHYLLFSSCDPATGKVLIDGSTLWMNPYGFLPGELYHFMPFYGVMSLMYLSLGVLWFILCARYWRELLRLQNCISGVIALGMVETATWYFDYVSFNSTGTRGIGPIVFGVFASTVKKTVSRLLVLVVCLGYGVVRPTLGNVATRVMLLGVVYFIFSMILDTVSNISPITEISVPLRLLFILPVAFLDATFYWWIFSGLSRTLLQLSQRKQSAKLTLYRRFSHVLILSIVLSAAWVTWQMCDGRRGARAGRGGGSTAAQSNTPPPSPSFAQDRDNLGLPRRALGHALDI